MLFDIFSVKSLENRSNLQDTSSGSCSSAGHTLECCHLTTDDAFPWDQIFGCGCKIDLASVFKKGINVFLNK